MNTPMPEKGLPRTPLVTRRRALVLCAAAAGLPLLARIPRARETRTVPGIEWRGRALGVDARLTFTHPDEQLVRHAVARARDEIDRLENIFSLYRAGSELVRLNRAGWLSGASHDLRQVLAEAARIGALSGGAFDVTVQPLWLLYRDSYSRGRAPEALDLAAARGLIGGGQIQISGDAVSLARPGMAVTLNGIAQGYITDRVARLLGALGFDRVVLQLGETFVLAPEATGLPSARGSRIGVADPRSPGHLVASARLSNRAMATSSGLATRFDGTGRVHHLFDPATGASANHALAVSVIAERALTADALSTALFIAPRRRAREILRAAGADSALFVEPDGSRTMVDASPRRLFRLTPSPQG